MTIVLQRAYVWTSLILVLAVLGAVLASRRRGPERLLPAVLAAAALLVPAEQARLHTTVSLHKHVVFGAWFAAIAAGYAMARLSRVDPGRGWAPGIDLKGERKRRFPRHVTRSGARCCIRVPPRRGSTACGSITCPTTSRRKWMM